DPSLGDASIIANTASPKIKSALEKLYREDADWNILLREMSSDAAKDHASFIEFLSQSTQFTSPEFSDGKISQQSLRPVFSTFFFECYEFHPKRFIDGLS